MSRKPLDERLTTHRVTYQRDEDTWLAMADDIPGAHSFGRTIASARANVREAIALVLDDDPESFELAEHIDIEDKSLSEAFADARRLRQEAEVAQTSAQEATVQALELFERSEEAFSVRDLSELLGISFQRVQQVLTDLRRSLTHL